MEHATQLRFTHTHSWCVGDLVIGQLLQFMHCARFSLITAPQGL